MLNNIMSPANRLAGDPCSVQQRLLRVLHVTGQSSRADLCKEAHLLLAIALPCVQLPAAACRSVTMATNMQEMMFTIRSPHAALELTPIWAAGWHT